MNEGKKTKIYKAVVKNSEIEKRITLFAISMDEARSFLEEKYGKGSIVILIDEEAANRIR